MTNEKVVPAAKKWRVSRLVALGYYDGPTEGVVELADGWGAYSFNMIAADTERDLRAIKLATLPPTKFDELVRLLEEELGPARWPIWVPMWEFRSDERRRVAEERVNAIYATAEPIAIAACDDTLERCLKVKDLRENPEANIEEWMRS